MQIFLWTENNSGSVEVHGDVIEFYDLPTLWNFSVGDEIQFGTKVGPIRFNIETVVPANLEHYSPDMRKVTARRK